MAGVISVIECIDPVRRGYAAAAGDNGHEALPGTPTAAAALRNQETLTDFGYSPSTTLASRESADCSLLRPPTGAELLRRLLRRRPRGADVRAALPR